MQTRVVKCGKACGTATVSVHNQTGQIYIVKPDSNVLDASNVITADRSTYGDESDLTIGREVGRFSLSLERFSIYNHRQSLRFQKVCCSNCLRGIHVRCNQIITPFVQNVQYRIIVKCSGIPAVA